MNKTSAWSCKKKLHFKTIQNADKSKVQYYQSVCVLHGCMLEGLNIVQALCVCFIQKGAALYARVPTMDDSCIQKPLPVFVVVSFA